MRRGGDRQMAFAAQQSRRRVEADPAGARQIHFRPGMQVGEVMGGAGGAFERFDVRPQLDEIAGDKASRQADVTKQLHHEPCAVAARARARLQRFLGCLYARLHADQIADHPVDTLVEFDQKIDGVARVARDRLDQIRQQRASGLRRDKGGKILAQFRRKGKRPPFGIGLDEEIERIDDFHVGDQIDRHGKFCCLFREDKARKPVAVRILLPIHEMLGRLHRKRIARNAGAAMRTRPQPNDLRAETDRAVVGVACGVMKPDKNGHAATRYRPICPKELAIPMQFPGRRNPLDCAAISIARFAIAHEKSGAVTPVSAPPPAARSI